MFSSLKQQNLEQSNQGPVLKKRLKLNYVNYAYEFILHVISAYFHRPDIHIDYQITYVCNVYQCIMIFLFVSHQRPSIQFRLSFRFICIYVLNSFIVGVTLFWILLYV